ncbi:hypothetical protein LCGC14_2028710, partial [marine sediment metagenome]
SKVHSRHELGNLVFYDAQYRQRWLDVVGPTAIKFIEDFAGDNPADTWIDTLIGTSSVASYDAEGGCILLNTAGADGDGVELQKLSGFKFIADCPIYFGVRWQLTGTTGAGSSSIMMGLCNEDTDLIASTSDGVYFDSASSGTALNFIMETASAETSAEALATIVVDTWYIDEFYWDGDDTVKFWHNGIFTGSGSAASMDQTQRMAVSLAWTDEVGHASGTTGLVVDWVRAIQLLDVRNV